MNHLGKARWLCALVAAMLAILPLGSAGAEGLMLDGAPGGAQVEAAVDAFVEQHRESTVAFSVGVARGGQTLLEKAYGTADVANGRAADLETVYEWGSATKLIVWVSVMQQVEQGNIELDADVRTYLPEGFLTKLKYDKPITMMNLMHHNAGWEDVLVGLFVPPGSANDDLESALRSSEPGQIYEPGTVVGYSNWGAALAGYIVERVSGQKFWQYAHKNVLEPLGMQRTALAPDLSDNAWVRDQRALVEGYAGQEWTPNRFAIPLYPAGMATGTLSDMLAFAKALAPQDGRTTPLFERPDTLQTMLTPSLLFGTGEPRNCHGFWAEGAGMTLIGHGGNTAAFSAMLLVHPQTHTALVVMTNQSGEEVYNYELPRLLYGAYVPKAGGEAPDVKDLAGLYRASRVSMSGCSRLYRLLMTVPLRAEGHDSLTTGPVFGSVIMKLNQVAPDIFEMDDASSLSMPMAVMRSARMPDGGAQLQLSIMDFVRVPAMEGVLLYGSVLLLLLALLYFAVALIGGGARWLVLKIRKRPLPRCSMRRFHKVLCALGLLEGVNICLMFVALMAYAPKWVVGISLGFSWLVAICAVVYLLLLALRSLGLNGPRWEKRVYGCTGLAGVLLVLNIVYWQLYRF